MSWLERLREAAYTPPGGDRLTFAYENVSKKFTKRTSAYNFPDAPGTYIQDLGTTGRRLPLRVFFSGDDHDLDADAFEAGLATPGVGLLEHPMYGSINVVPFGTIKRRDDLRSAANQTVIEVEFYENNALIFPASQKDPASAVLSAVVEFNEAQAREFAENLDIEKPSRLAIFKARYEQVLTTVKNKLQVIADIQEDVRAKFNAVSDSINRGIDVIIRDPLTLAFQTAELIQVPGRALADIHARFNAYKDLASQIFSGPRDILPNDFYNDDLFTSSMVSGAIVSLVNSSARPQGSVAGANFTAPSNAIIETKTEALELAIGLLEFFEEVTAWRDDLATDLNLIDTGAAYQQLHEAVALTAGFLVQISFTLKQERIITLDRNRTVIDLVAELYGEVDSQLDFFIVSNRLTGSEILELPAGRNYKYYV